MQFRVAQSVVTDAGSGRSAGYSLVAWSPSLAPKDADALQSRPEITDYLHQSESPGLYRSFFPLPSGAWALSFRFVEGHRRGTYNRVVVHTLVLAAEVLANGYDAFAISGCRFAPASGGAECTLDELLARSARADGMLSDLELRPPPASGGEWPPRLEGKLHDLLNSLPAARVEADLAWIYAAWRRGQRVLLADGERGRLLLTLACAALPRDDRMRTPWTEHLAGGAAFSYYLACAPDPAELALSGQLVDQWEVFPMGGAPAVGDEGALAFAKGLLGPAGAAQRAELEACGISVIAGEELTLWARSRGWTEGGERGAASVREFLERVTTPRGQLLRWIDGNQVVVRLARNLRAREDDDGANAQAVRESIAALEDRRQLELVHPRNVAAAAVPQDVAAYAVLLSLASRGASPAADEVEPLVGLLAQARRDPAWSDAAVQLIVPLLDHVPPLIGTIERLGPTSTELNRVADMVAQRAPGDEKAHLRVFRLATTLRADEAARRVVHQYLLPIWEQAEDDGPQEELDEALQALLGDPARFADALTRLRGRCFAIAVELLKKVARHSDGTAREIASALAGLDLPHLPGDPAVRGVADALREAGAAVDGWMPFLLAEAALVDAGDSPDAALVRGIKRITLPPATAYRVLQRFAENEPEVWAPCHHAIFERAFQFAQPPELAARIVSRVANHGGAERGHWDETVAEVAEKLGADRGVEIRRDWLLGLARNGTLPLSPASRGMVDMLPEAARLAVVDAWSQWVPDLAEKDPPTWQRLRKIAEGDPQRSFPFTLNDLRKELEVKRIDAPQALLSANEVAARTDDPVRMFALACETLLPSDTRAAALVVLELAASPRLWLASIEALRTPHLASALGHVTARELAGVAQREPRWLALEAASQLGRIWSSDVPATLGFVGHAWGQLDAELLGRFRVASRGGEGPAFPDGLDELLEMMLTGRTRDAGWTTPPFRSKAANRSRERR